MRDVYAALSSIARRPPKPYEAAVVLSILALKGGTLMSFARTSSTPAAGRQAVGRSCVDTATATCRRPTDGTIGRIRQADGE